MLLPIDVPPELRLQLLSALQLTIGNASTLVAAATPWSDARATLSGLCVLAGASVQPLQRGHSAPAACLSSLLIAHGERDPFLRTACAPILSLMHDALPLLFLWQLAILIIA